MHEVTDKGTVNKECFGDLTQCIMENFHLAPCIVDVEEGLFKFAGVTIFDDRPFLLSITADKDGGEVRIRINCENTILASMAKTRTIKVLAALTPNNEK
jgi:hypothetical protein